MAVPNLSPASGQYVDARLHHIAGQRYAINDETLHRAILVILIVIGTGLDEHAVVTAIANDAFDGDVVDAAEIGRVGHQIFADLRADRDDRRIVFPGPVVDMDIVAVASWIADADIARLDDEAIVPGCACRHVAVVERHIMAFDQDPVRPR